MSGRGEQDDEDFVETQDRAPASGLTPVAPPIIHGSDDDVGYDVVETDDLGEVLGSPQRDARLTQDDQGDQPIIRQQPDQDQSRAPQSRRERRAANKDARAADERERQRLENELRQANSRLENLETIVAGVQPRLVELGEENIKAKLAGIDQQVTEANAAYLEATRRQTSCLENADYAGFTAAQEARDRAMIQRERLSNTKAAVEISLKRAQDGGQQDGGQRLEVTQDGRGFDVRRQPQSPQVQQPSPQVQRHLRQFGDEHQWYGQRGNELDTNMVKAIDKDVYDRGFKPDTQEYWDEINDLMRERLPHRFQNQSRDDRLTDDPAPRSQQRQAQPAQQQRRGGPPVPGPADRSPPQGKRPQVRIDPQRKQAMIDTGSIDSSGRILDDAKYRKQLKSYADYDRQNTQQR